MDRINSEHECNWRDLVRLQCEDEYLIRQEAIKVLPDMEVYGDSYGVPSVLDIVESLVKRLQRESEDK